MFNVKIAELSYDVVDAAMDGVEIQLRHDFNIDIDLIYCIDSMSGMCEVTRLWIDGPAHCLEVPMMVVNEQSLEEFYNYVTDKIVNILAD